MISEEIIDHDLKAAMKAKDENKVLTLRMVKAAITTFKIDKKKEKPDESDLQQILQRQVKQRRESIESFEKAGRTDLALKEQREMAVLETYLPRPLTADEIRALLSDAIRKTGAASKADIGKVMKEIMPLVKGKADGKTVNEVLSSLLT
jgi:uncharacterized protein YqeY